MPASKKRISSSTTSNVYLVFVAFLVLHGFSIALFKRGIGPFTFFTVNSGSMEPELPINSLLIVQKQTSYDLADIVTFSTDVNAVANGKLGKTTTHRVSSIKNNDQLEVTAIITKGDANIQPDYGSVQSANIVGKVIADIPYLGQWFQLASSAVYIVVYQMLVALVIAKEVSGIIKPKKILRFN